MFSAVKLRKYNYRNLFLSLNWFGFGHFVLKCNSTIQDTHIEFKFSNRQICKKHNVISPDISVFMTWFLNYVNPRQTKRFYVTRLTNGGVVATPYKFGKYMAKLCWFGAMV